MLKQEMVSMNINILGISKLKWTGMGKVISEVHYIYYGGQESIRKSGVDLTVNERVQNAVLGYSLKNNRMILVRFQDKPLNITLIQVYTPTTNAKDDEIEWFYEDLQDLLELTPKKKKDNVLFIIIGFPHGSDDRQSACNAGNPGSIPALGRSPGEGNGYPLQYSCLENPMDRGA